MKQESLNGEQILAILLAKQGNLSALANELLSEFNRQFPLDRLGPLLNHSDPEIVRLGVWILSELGTRGRPFVRLLPAFLHHELKYVRFFALDSVLSCASSNDGELVASAVCLVGDPEKSVRWNAIEFIVRASEEVLRASEPFIAKTCGDVHLTQAFRSLVNETSDVRDLLQSDVAIVRRVGLAIALRRKSEKDLETAAASDDEEVREIAVKAKSRAT